MSQEIRSIAELYADNPEAADKLLWDREVNPESRRGFLKKSSLLAMTAVVGSHIPFASQMPGGLIPIALANADVKIDTHGKHAELILLEERPFTMETPAHLLDDDVTPNDKFFVRNNGIPPVNTDPKTWTLTIDGEAMKEPKTYTLDELKSKFKSYTYHLWVECGGNGRKHFTPVPRGNQWDTGAIGCPSWTGVRLKDVLKDAGYDEKKAVYIGYYGADTHLSGDPTRVVISRGAPMSRALENETILAFQMNGGDIPLMHGAPLRLLVPGFPGSSSGKWVNRISVRDKVHDGSGMGGSSYRLPCDPVAPGEKVAEDAFCIIEAMPIKSVISSPKTGEKIALGQTLKVRGKAWDGNGTVKEVHVSIDFGATWQKAKLAKGNNKYAWQTFEADLKFPKKGYYEVWARATDPKGVSQPMVVPGWNPRGYANNMAHRIAVYVG